MATWILLTQWMAWLVMGLLVALSVVSVSIMIDRNRAFSQKTGPRSLAELKKAIEEADPARIRQLTEGRNDLGAGTLKVALQATGKAISAEAVERAVRGYLNEERAGLESGLTVLATLGSNAPFIGLFGTVLGVIHAFAQLATSQQGTQVVMAGISEALVATAIGLFVAIPAVVGYNVYSRKLRALLTDCEVLRDLYLARMLRG